MEVICNESLKKYTTIKIGGIAKRLYIPESTDELIELINKLNSSKLYIISGGSNLLINDEKVFEEVISLKKMDDSIKKLNNGRYYVGASVRLQKLINFINCDGYGGIEYLYSLPALVGGAIAMNAGRGRAHNLCISDYLEEIYVYDYENHVSKVMKKEECQFEYRNSIFKKNKLIVVGAIFNFDKMNKEETKKLKEERIELVKKLQDSSGYNFGSVFRKYNKYVMQIIKMISFGNKNGVRFSKKTSNWIINNGDGSYKQVCVLIDKVIKIHRILKKDILLEVVRWD